VEEVLLAQPEIADSPQAAPLPRLRREIQLSGLSFGYRHDRPVLIEVDAVIAAGEKVAFVGPTGAGKSSLLQLLMRFYDPSAGAVLFDGRDVRTAGMASLRSQIGMVFQETFLFDGSVRENIGLGSPGAAAEQIVAAAQAAQLHEFVSTLPHGYDTPVGERGVRLSGGQRQRLAIARALVRDPAVLLLDEATSALDPRTERMITDTLEAAGEGRTTIAVTHRLTSVVSYDRIFVLDEGRIVEEGKHEELLAHGGVYAELWAEQSGGATAVDPGADAVRAGLPAFAEVEADRLHSLSKGAVHLCLEPAETLAEGGGRLYVVTAGRGEILKPGPDGGLVFDAPLTPGQAFGISALAGGENRSVLRAVEAMELLVISAEIGGLPPAWMRRGADLPAIRPAGGERLSQVRIPPPLTYGMSPSDGAGRASGLH
jgi:ABC-type multidrug transport system ATPase subunit